MTGQNIEYSVVAGIYPDHRGVIGIIPPLPDPIAQDLLPEVPGRTYSVMPNPQGTEIFATSVAAANVGVMAVHAQLKMRLAGLRVNPSDHVTRLELGQSIIDWALEPIEGDPTGQ